MGIIEDIDRYVTQCHLMKTPRVLLPRVAMLLPFLLFVCLLLFNFTDQVSLFILAARELRAKCVAHP